MALTTRDVVRHATRTGRALPDVLVIGAQKSGTSSLFTWLCASPDFVPPDRKEAHYFTKHYDRGRTLGFYRRHFPLRVALRGAKITGEATPYTMFHPAAPQRVNEHLPDVRLIAILRNPVDRAWSHYRMEVARGHETLPFEDAINREDKRISQSPDGHQRFSYLARGRYAEQLERWSGLFGADRILVLRAEDAFADPQVAAGRVFGWLGVRPAAVPVEPVNVGGGEPMPAPVRRRLEDYFAPHNRRLERLIGWSWVQPST